MDDWQATLRRYDVEIFLLALYLITVGAVWPYGWISFLGATSLLLRRKAALDKVSDNN